MNIYTIGFAVMGLILLLICVGLVGYVAMNRPPHGKAASFTMTGVVLILFSQLLQSFSGPFYNLVPFELFDIYFVGTAFVSNVLWVGGLVALLKAVYSASNKESAGVGFETFDDGSDRPPFNVVHQPEQYR